MQTPACPSAFVRELEGMEEELVRRVIPPERALPSCLPPFHVPKNTNTVGEGDGAAGEEWVAMPIALGEHFSLLMIPRPSNVSRNQRDDPVVMCPQRRYPCPLNLLPHDRHYHGKHPRERTVASQLEP